MFSAAIDRYLREITPDKSPRTQLADRYRATLLCAFFGRYSLAAISPDLIARYRDQRLASRSRSSRHQRQTPAPFLAPATVRLELTLLSHLFTTALREWRLGLAQNPTSLVRKPKPSESRIRRLSADEEKTLAAAFADYSNPMLGWIFRIALETGMRAGEIRSLRLSQVDLTRRVILLTDTKNHCTRTVPLTMRATESLRAAIASPARPTDCNFIFYGQANAEGRCGSYLFGNAWWKIRSRLGIHDLRFHDLRHEAISRLVEAGLSDLEVASISGHKAMQMLKRYTHLRAQDLVKKLDRLGRSTGKSPTSRRRTPAVPSPTIEISPASTGCAQSETIDSLHVVPQAY